MTEQIKDKIKINDVEYLIENHSPFYSYLELPTTKELNLQLSKKEHYSCCARGYVSEWELKEEKLLMTYISISTPLELPARAYWFSGEIVIRNPSENKESIKSSLWSKLLKKEIPTLTIYNFDKGYMTGEPYKSTVKQYIKKLQSRWKRERKTTRPDLLVEDLEKNNSTT